MRSAPVPDWLLLQQRDRDSLAAVEPGREVTAGELCGLADAAARALHEAGVRPGDRVVVALPSSVDFAAAYLGVRLCGGVLVNVPWQWRRELLGVVEETDARAVVLDKRVDPVVGSELAELAVALPRSQPGPNRHPPVAARGPDEIAWLAYSSGTTARPKGAVHTEKTLALIADGFVQRYSLVPDDVVLVAAPAGHAVGFVYGVELALRAGCAMALLPSWSATACAELTARYGCTLVAAPTPLLLDVVELAEQDGPGPFASLRVFLCGGAPIPTSLLERARAALPETDVTAYYGTSECGGVTTCPPDAAERKKLTTEGAPLPGMEVCVDGGELLVRGVQLARGYWSGGESHRFRADGWFATGDEATLDADGYIRIVGRLDDRIVRGGVNISPVEVEQVLAAHPAVREVAVVGAPDPRLGQRVAAIIVGEPTSLADLREHCRAAGLAKLKWPELVVPVSELPRSPSGKVLRAELRHQLEGA